MLFRLLRDASPGVLYVMEKEEQPKQHEDSGKTDAEAQKRKLARPPKDKREVTIGPTTGPGPDITVS